MTLEEYKKLEQEQFCQEKDIKDFLETKGISAHQYYYWKRKVRDLESTAASSGGQFLPIDLQTGGKRIIRRQRKPFKQPIITQGEVEIELRTTSGAELRIRGMLDAVILGSIIASSGGGLNV